MIITLATNAVAQGLMVVYTGGFSPQDSATRAMRYLATGFTIPGVPNAVIIWAVIGAAMVFVLTRTGFGRTVYGIGNRERAAYLSGIDTRRVVMIAFAVSGGLSAFGGVLLAGYASKAAQSMGDAYLLPSIAAVVLGGTHILGGRGSYLGTIAGVILITLLQSILSVMQIDEGGRQLTRSRARSDRSKLITPRRSTTSTGSAICKPPALGWVPPRSTSPSPNAKPRSRPAPSSPCAPAAWRKEHHERRHSPEDRRAIPPRQSFPFAGSRHQRTKPKVLIRRSDCIRMAFISHVRQQPRS
eukprot:gene11830-15789_t